MIRESPNKPSDPLQSNPPLRIIPSAPSIRRHFSGTNIPDDWLTPRLGDLVDKAAPICYGILMPGDHVPGGIPVIKVKDYVGGDVDSSSVARTTPEIDNAYRRSKVKAGDLLLSIRGGTGDVAIVPTELDGANITQDTARLRANNATSNRYLLHALKGGFVGTQIKLETIGQAVTGINISSVRMLVVPTPKLNIQRKISAILDTWSAVLDLQDSLIAEKERYRLGLAQKLLCGELRLPGYDVSNGARVKDRYNEYPRDWDRVSLGEITREVAARNDTEANYPVLSCTKYDGLVLSDVYFGRRVYSDDTSNYRLVLRGQFAYATNHIEEGSIGYQNICDAGLVSPIYTVFETAECIDDRFLYLLFKSPLLVHHYRTNTSASVDRRGSLRYAEFARIKVWLPKLEEQRAIGDLFDSCDNELVVLKKQRRLFAQQKQALMQQLLTGKTQVKIA